MSKLPSISLEFREGTSDKVYKAAIEEAQGGYVVNFAFGRRGSTLQTGTKTSTPVTLDEASEIYGELVRSKTSKGYKPTGKSEGIGASVAALTDQDQRDTGLRPQLLNPISEDQAATYLRDRFYAAQEKFDGKRMMIRKDKNGIVAANRKGLSIGFPDALAKALGTVKDTFVIDGEAVGDTFHAFDLLETNGADLRGEPYSLRLDRLAIRFDGCPKTIVVAKTAFVTEDKIALMEELKGANKEGIVFKELNAQWHPGRPASGGSALKCKFWSSCSAVVSKINAKRSIEVSLDGQPVGNITVPPNHDLPKVGQVVEVRYLYVAGKGGSLYQPVYLGVRDDIGPEDCTFDKQRLKYKPENED
jgi:bifunctional non-homologous end joining protein LigD